MSLDVERYIVYGSLRSATIQSSQLEVSCNSEIAARLHAAAFTTDGRSPSIYDTLAKRFVPVSTETPERIQ